MSNSYGEWLENEQKKYKAEKTPKDAMTFAEYLVYSGVNPAEQYKANVSAAESAYKQGQATYGQTGERMARAGLTGGGYGEYLAGKNYEMRAKNMATARDTATNQLGKAKAGYGEYLATKQGEAQEGANKDAAYSALAQAVSNGLSLDAAIASMQGGQFSPYLDDAKQRYLNVVGAQFGSGIGNNSGIVDYTAKLDEMQKGGTVTKETYTALADKGKHQNYINFSKANQGDYTALAPYIDRLAKVKKDGTVKKSGAEIWEKMGDDERTGKIEEWFDEMYSEGKISEADYTAHYYESAKNDIKSISNGREALNYIENLGTRLANGQISPAQYTELRKSALQSVEEVTESRISGEYRDKGQTVIDISYKQGSKGKEKISLELYGGKADDGKFMPVNKIGQYEVGIRHGELVVRKDGKIYKTQYSKTKDNAAFEAWVQKHAK